MSYYKTTKKSKDYIGWNAAWKDGLFRQKAIITLFLLIMVVIFAPAFFNFIEKRNGPQLNDPVLNILPAFNVSVPIFTIIWFMFLLAIIRSIQSPDFFLVFIIGYLLICLSRFITITLIPLNPPAGMIELADPLTNLFYGNLYISKDLFYSGHTSTLLLMAFCFRKRGDKILGVIASLIVAILLLVQHVHYTIDIIASPFFSGIIFRFAKKITFLKATPNTQVTENRTDD